MKPITDVLRSLRGGVLIDDATTALAAIVTATMESGKPGKVTIELTINKMGRTGAVIVRDKLTVKMPKEEQLETIMYASPEGSLLTQDPRQATLELRDVTAIDIPMKEISNG